MPLSFLSFTRKAFVRNYTMDFSELSPWVGINCTTPCNYSVAEDNFYHQFDRLLVGGSRGCTQMCSRLSDVPLCWACSENIMLGRCPMFCSLHLLCLAVQEQSGALCGARKSLVSSLAPVWYMLVEVSTLSIPVTNL